MTNPSPGSAPVIDQRPAPRGVLPRGTQTWLMVGLALGIVGIIVMTGHPEPTPRPTTTAQPLAPNPDRLREYHDRLRSLDERARPPVGSDPRPTVPQPLYDDPPAPSPAPDPLAADRQRREYESLFSSNVVMSRRVDGHRLTMDQAAPPRTVRSSAADDAVAPPPSLDDVADAVVRATTRYAPDRATTPLNSPLANPASASLTSVSPAATPTTVRPAASGPITAVGPVHRLLEGTLIDTVLTNRLDGAVAAPVNCLVTNAVYSHDGQHVLIPAGSRVLGETKPVQTLGDTRLAVVFNRLTLPDGRTYPLDQFLGLNEIGDAGLRDQVNHHYRSIFGASAAVGLITGLAQYFGAAGLNRGGGDRTVIIAGNVGDATAQATTQTMNRYLNRLPHITIREGHRVKVYLTSDLELPVYEARTIGSRPLLATSRWRSPS